MSTDPSCNAPSVANTAFSIFQEPWWLDATAPGQWQEVRVEAGGRTLGRLPFVLSTHRFGRHLKMPPLNQYLGPWLDPGEGKYATQLANQHKILEQLIEQLPPFDAFEQHFAPDVTNWLPFYWAGFQATVRYTYRIEDLSDLDAVWKETRDNIRTDVRKAEKKLVVRDDLGMERFFDTHCKTFLRQSMQPPFARDLLARLDEACRARSAGKALFAVDAQERIHAVVYYVWSPRTCFYLLSGADPDLRNSGATSLLVWEGIKLAQRVSTAFDFEGSMIPGVERFTRSFGARQTPYFRVSKFSRRLEAAKALNKAWRAFRGKRT